MDRELEPCSGRDSLGNPFRPCFGRLPRNEAGKNAAELAWAASWPHTAIRMAAAVIDHGGVRACIYSCSFTERVAQAGLNGRSTGDRLRARSTFGGLNPDM